MTDPDALNAFESGMLPTAARTKAEGAVEQLRVRGGVFVEAVRATRMAMVLTDPALPGNPIVFANQSFLTLSGYTLDEVLGQQPYFLNGPDTHPRDAARFRQALAEDQDETLQTIQYRKDGSRMVVSLFLTALKDDAGRTLYHLLSWRDISRQVAAEEEVDTLREAQAALCNSEERQAFQLQLSDALASLSDHADIQAAAARLVAGQLGVGWCYFNEFDDRGTHATVLGDFHRNGLPSMVGVHDLSGERDFLDLMGSEAMLDMPDLTNSEHFSAQAKATYGALGIRSALGAPLLRNGRLAAVLLVADTSVRRWVKGDSELLRGVAERTWAAIERARVEAALHESERRQRLLLDELQHRVRNILTMVRSVARRTAENCEDVDDYVRHLDGRLSALARVQTILTREPERGVNLHNMILDEFKSQATLPAQYDIDGPEIELSAKAAEVLSLGIHELATNSIKYGVLGKLSGAIQIRWAIEERDGRDWLQFTWKEPVDPNIKRPARTGFGTELITHRVPYELRGSGEILISDNEVEARIGFPLACGQSESDSVAAQRT